MLVLIRVDGSFNGRWPGSILPKRDGNRPNHPQSHGSMRNARSSTGRPTA